MNSSNTKGYTCDLCSKSFNRPSALQTHIYTHTGEKPHQCDIVGCGRRFAVVSNLRRHLRVHQPNYVRRRLTSQERRVYVERLIQKSAGDNTQFNNTIFEHSSYRLLKPKQPISVKTATTHTRPIRLTLQHLLN